MDPALYFLVKSSSSRANGWFSEFIAPELDDAEQVYDLDDDVVDPDWLDIEGELDERITWWTFPLHGLNHRPPQCQASPSTYL